MTDVLAELGIGAMDVHVKSMPAEERTLIRQSFRTVVLSAQNQMQNILDGPDPNRYRYFVLADAAVILSDSQGTAQSANNLATGLAYPAGAYIPPNVLIGPLAGQSEVWASAFVTGATLIRVTVISSHKVKT
jgi:hypothetical protein